MRSTVKALGRFTSLPLPFEPSRARRSNQARFALLWLALLLPVWAAIPPPRVQFAYFYKPPQDGTPASFLVDHYQLILLTHGDESYLAELRRDGYKGVILQTVEANEAEGPGPYLKAQARCDAAYPPYESTVADRKDAFCAQIHPHESWFLHNRKGQRLYTRYQSANGVWRTFYEMNPGSRGWRQYVIARLRQYRHLGFDGFFFDNVELSRAGYLLQTEDRDGLAEYRDDQQLQHAVAGYLAAVHAALPGVPLWANLTHDPERRGDWDAYLPYLNGLMVEDFALGWADYGLSPAAGMAQLANIQSALAGGKQVLLVAQGTHHDEARRRFTLALAWALLPPGGGVYYRYNNAGVWDYRQVWWSALYDQRPPVARGNLQCDATACTRAYDGGKMRLNLAQQILTVPAGWPRVWQGEHPGHNAPRKAPPPDGR